MAGAGTYNVRNSSLGTTVITDADGNPHSIIQGGSLTVALSAAGYVQAVGQFGAANVVPQIINPTYKFAVLGLTPVPSPTDVVVIQGSATKTINITKIKVGGAATAQGAIPFTVVRRSTAGTLGSAVLTPVTAALTDILNDAAPTAVISTVGTANYTTLGNSAGQVESARVGLPALSTGTAGDAQKIFLEYGDNNDQPLKLRGTTDFICINFGGAAVPAGGVLDFTIETFEDNS